MPWVLSALVHLGVFLIMLFIMMILAAPTPKTETGEVVYVPTAPQVHGDPYNRGGAKPTAARRSPVKWEYEPRDSILPGVTKERVELGDLRPGAGDSPLGDGPHNGKGRGLYGLGDLDGPSGSGGAANIVYVVDRSGSMAKTFEDVKAEMRRSISRLWATQRFHVVLFGDGETYEGPRRRLVQAEIENKVAACEFLQTKEARGSTTALIALKRAFEVLSARPANETKMIFLVSDGDFSGISGGSEYRSADGRTLNGNEAVLQWLADNNKAPKVHICTVLLHSADRTAADVLRKIAEQNNGRFKYISPDE